VKNVLLSTDAVVSWHGSNKEHFINKGYKFTKIRDKFIAKIEDLLAGSKVIVSVQCDFCDKEFTKNYNNYLLNRKNYPKDCCSNKDCRAKKFEESMLANYGVKSPLELDEVQEKIKQTNLIKYGVENVFANNDIKQRIAQTNIEKYGTENPFQSEIIKEKIKNTTLSKYGKEYPMQIESVKKKMYETKAKNGTNNYSAMFPIINGVAASKPQIKLGKFLKGKINAYICGKFVDICLEENNIVIEYDGGGHTLDVKTNRITEEEFYLREKNAEKKLLVSGWRIIRISNEQDKALSYEEISKQIEEFSEKDSTYLNIKIS
jgi:very-short-patch-repair endonuclease